jgi:hypothetical protein
MNANYKYRQYVQYENNNRDFSRKQDGIRKVESPETEVAVLLASCLSICNPTSWIRIPQILRIHFWAIALDTVNLVTNGIYILC